MSMAIEIGDDRDDRRDDSRDDEDVLDERDDERGSDRRRPQADRTRHRSRNETEDADVDGDEDDDERKSPEELRAELKQIRAALAKSNSGGGRLRARLREAREALVSRETSDDTDDDESDDPKPKDGRADARQVQRTVEKAVKARERELQEQHRRDLIDTRADTALTRAGVSEKNIRLLKRELDYQEIDFDPKTRAIDGLDEEIERLQSEFPDLFRKGGRTGRRINGGDGRGETQRPKNRSASSQQAARLTGRG